ncbi:MAG: hypothetical protein ABIL25_05190 [candidate division WOR-3 bacterium]
MFKERETGSWPGIAVANDALAKGILACAHEPVGVGVPDEDPSPQDLLVELGKDAVLIVVSDTKPGPGPAIVDFRTRPAVVDRRGRLGILELERELGEMVQLGAGLVFSVLVVCTGNCCRSPMAAGLLSQMLGPERVFIYSAGTDAPVGSPATSNAIVAAGELGVDLTLHRSQLIDTGLVQNADLVLVMEEYHRRRVLELVPGAESKTRLVAEQGIADPLGQPLEAYRRTAAELRRYLVPVAHEIRQRIASEKLDTSEDRKAELEA